MVDENGCENVDAGSQVEHDSDESLGTVGQLPDKHPTGAAMNSNPEWTDASDIELMVGVAAKNELALRNLIERYSPVVMAVCLKILKNRSDAEEVAAELFVELWERGARFDESRGKPRSYILLLARSRSLDRIRKRATRPVTLLGSDAKMEELATEAFSPEAPFELRELSEAIKGSLADLPDIQNETISLAFFEGLTHREISSRLDLPLGTVKTHIRAGLMKLRTILKSSSERKD